MAIVTGTLSTSAERPATTHMITTPNIRGRFCPHSPDLVWINAQITGI